MCSNDAPILALVHVEAGLLPAQQVRRKAQSMLTDFEVCTRRPARGQPAEQREALLPAHRCVRPLDDARRTELRLERREQLGAADIHAQGEELDDQPVAVPVHDQPRHAVALRIDQAIGRGLRLQVEVLTRRARRGQPPLPEACVDGLVPVPGEQADDNLRARVEVAAGQPCAARVRHIHDVTRRGAARRAPHRTGENPGMALPDGSLLAR